MQAAVSAKLHIFGFDAGRGMPQSLLVWFFEPGTISSLIPPLAVNVQGKKTKWQKHNINNWLSIDLVEDWKFQLIK